MYNKDKDERSALFIGLMVNKSEITQNIDLEHDY